MAGSIKGITIELDGNTTKLTAALKNVNTAVRQTQTQLKNVERALKLNPGNVQALQTKFSALGTKISETREKLRLLKEAEEQAVGQLARGEISQGEFDALQAEIAATTEELKALEREYAQFGSVGAQQVAAVGAKMDAFGQKIAAVGDKLTMSVTMPLAMLGGAAVKNFAEVDKTMTLTNQTMGNTAAEADLLNTAMKDAAANSTYGMSDAATATLNFARAGLDAEQAAAALAPTMNLAAGEGGDLDTVSAGLVATINGFHGSFDQAAQYADVFANACNNSALDVNSLSSAMSVAAPIFSAAGYSVHDAALYMGVMANNGIEADKAANSLKTGIARLVSPAKEGAQMMNALGIEITNADGSMKDSVTVQRELHDAFAQLSESEQIAAASAIFGKNQMAPWLALINSAPEDVAALSGALMEEGTTAEMAAAMMGGFGGSLEKLKSSLDVAIYSLGEALAPTILKVSTGIQKVVDWFNQLSPATQTLIANVLLIVAAIGPVLAIGGRLISGVGKILSLAPMIVNAFNGIKTAISFVSGAFTLLNPTVLIVVGVIAALVAAGVLLYQNWDTIKAKAQELGTAISTAWTGLTTAVSTAWETLKTNCSAAWEAITTTVQTNWDAMRNAISSALSAIQSVVSTVWSAISTTVTTVVTTVSNTISSVWSALTGTVSSIWNSVKSAVQSAFDPVKSIVSGIVDNVRDKLVNTWNGISGTVSGIFSAIKEAMTKPIDAAKSALETAVDRIKSIFSVKIQGPKLSLPSVSVSGKFSLNPPSVPHFSLSWHKDAYKNAMLFTSPTVLGTPNGYHGFGDGNGGELVIGEKYLQSMIAQAAGTQAMDARLARIEQIVTTGFNMVENKEMRVDGKDLVYANRNAINEALGLIYKMNSR